MYVYIYMDLPGRAVVKNSPASAGDGVQSLSQEEPLEKEMTIYSSILAWRNPQTEKSGGLQSMGSQSDLTERLSIHTCTLIHIHIKLNDFAVLKLIQHCNSTIFPITKKSSWEATLNLKILGFADFFILKIFKFILDLWWAFLFYFQIALLL